MKQDTVRKLKCSHQGIGHRQAYSSIKYTRKPIIKNVSPYTSGSDQLKDNLASLIKQLNLFSIHTYAQSII